MQSTNFDGGHFENGVPQVVHPNLLMVASTFHVWTSPRNKIKLVSYVPGRGGGVHGVYRAHGLNIQAENGNFALFGVLE